MPDESDSPPYQHLTDSQADRAIKLSLGPIKPRDYDDVTLHRRLDRFDQRVEETSTATLASQPEARAGILKIPEVKGKRDLEKFLGSLTTAIDKMEAVLYKTDYMMRYKQLAPDVVAHHYPVRGIEYYSDAELKSLEMYSSMAEMLRAAMVSNGKQEGTGKSKSLQIKTTIKSPTGVDITNQGDSGHNPARFELTMSRPYQYVDDEGKTHVSQELIQIGFSPLEYAPYNMIEAPNEKLQEILLKAHNATRGQLQTMLGTSYKNRSPEDIIHLTDGLHTQAKKLGADVPHMTIRYDRGPQRIELRGNLKVEDGFMGFQLEYPQLKAEAFAPIYDNAATAKVEEGLHHVDANRLYNIGMAIASTKTTG